jgi:hypothetical protein
MVVAGKGLVLLEAVAKELGVDDATRVCLYDLSLDVVVPHRTYDSLLAARLTMTKTSTAQEEDEGEGRRGDGDDDGAAEWYVCSYALARGVDHLSLVDRWSGRCCWKAVASWPPMPKATSKA